MRGLSEDGATEDMRRMFLLESAICWRLRAILLLAMVRVAVENNMVGNDNSLLDEAKR